MTAGDWRQDLDKLKAALLHAASERDDRPGFDEESGELGWVLHERAVMHAEVNRLRAELGKSPVAAEDIITVETSACGHIDYISKYAIGAADLVHRF